MTKLKLKLVSALESLEHPDGRKRRAAFWLIALLLPAITGLVYLLGGSKYVYVHLVYMPILFAAIVFQVRGGIVAAVAAGFLLGPLMPLDRVAGEMQKPLNWLTRLVIFILVGALFGLAVELLQHLRRRAQETAYYDAFTSLPNQNKLQVVLEEAIRQYPDGPLKLVIFNLDNYIELFYTLGTKATTSLLLQVSRRLHYCLPQGTDIYQLQTNKFCVLLTPASGISEGELLYKVDFAFNMEMLYVESVPVYVEISSGIAAYPEHADNAEDLLLKAGIALYAAKRMSERYCYYQVQKDWTSRGHLALLSTIPGAIARNEFILHYQPVYHLEKGSIHSAEALVRWRHPQRGLLYPSSFLSEIENTALINNFTRWLLAKVVERLAVWEERGILLDVAVNISPKNLRDEELVPYLAVKLQEMKVDPARLYIEVTENAVVEDFEQAKKTLQRLKGLGVKIALDDFGTGFTSLAVLQQLPVDIVKIDRTFIQGLVRNEKNRAIVHAIVTMAAALGMKVTAEGVETEEVLTILASMKCDHAQGYLLGKPLSELELLNLLGWREEIKEYKRKREEKARGKRELAPLPESL